MIFRPYNDITKVLSVFSLWILSVIHYVNGSAFQGRILPTGTRDSTLEIIVGDSGWVTHQENGILYSFDTTKCMFSSGNLSEKLRMACQDCSNEVIVDLFAGIGYFVLPFLVKYALVVSFQSNVFSYLICSKY